MRMIGIRQVADRSGLSIFTVRTYVRDRLIPFYKIGARVLFDKQEIEDWLAARRVSEVDGKVPHPTRAHSHQHHEPM